MTKNMNCDGCQRGLPIGEKEYMGKKVHMAGKDEVHIFCTADRYKEKKECCFNCKKCPDYPRHDEFCHDKNCPCHSLPQDMKCPRGDSCQIKGCGYHDTIVSKLLSLSQSIRECGCKVLCDSPESGVTKLVCAEHASKETPVSESLREITKELSGMPLVEATAFEYLRVDLQVSEWQARLIAGKIGVCADNVFSKMLSQEIEKAREEAKAMYGSASGRLLEDIARQEEREKIAQEISSKKDLISEDTWTMGYNSGLSDAIEVALKKNKTMTPITNTKKEDL